MRKRIVFLLSVMLFLSIILCGCQKVSETTEMSGNLTRREWAGLLGDKFGYNSYESTQDFYSDVSVDSAYYDEIQACASGQYCQKQVHFIQMIRQHGGMR